MKEVFLLDKKEAIDLLSKKLNDDHNLSYDKLAIITGHSKRQLIRPLKEKGIDSTLNHSDKGLAANNRASDNEIDYIVNFKKPYPNITIAQFRDIYLVDVIFNPSKEADGLQYNLKVRIISFFQRLYKQFNWSSPSHITSQWCTRLSFSNSTSAHEVGLSPTGFLYSLTHFKFIANYLEQAFVNRKYHAPINMAYKQLPVAQNDDVDTSSDLDISEIDF